jgi:hypothetical protein
VLCEAINVINFRQYQQYDQFSESNNQRVPIFDVLDAFIGLKEWLIMPVKYKGRLV